MTYEDNLTGKIEESMASNFPEADLKVVRIDKVSDLYKDKLETRTYRCVLKGDFEMIVFVKRFTDHKIEKMGGIGHIDNFNEYKEDLRIPEVYDIYEDINSVVVEGVEGEKSSKLFPIYLLPFIRARGLEKIKNILKEVALGTANLHSLFSNKDDTVTSYNDLKLGNILFNGEDVKVIDFEMINRDYTEDIVCLLVSLEMLQKFPHISKEDVGRMKDFFLEKYEDKRGIDIDKGALRKKVREKRREVLKTLMDDRSRRGTDLFERLLMAWNVSYMKRRVSGV